MYSSKPNWSAFRDRRKKLSQEAEARRNEIVLKVVRIVRNILNVSFIQRYYYLIFLIIGLVFALIPNAPSVLLSADYYEGSLDFGDDLVLVQDDAASPLSNISDEGIIGKVYVPTAQSERKKFTDIIEYQIQKGDSLSGIARKFGVSQKTILAVNSLSASQLLRIGHPLTIIPVDGVLYTVKQAETISDIAKKFKAKPEDIVYQNKLAGLQAVPVAGTRLIIPGGVLPPPPVAKKPATSIVSALKNKTTGQKISSPSGANQKISTGDNVKLSSPVFNGVLTQGYGFSHQALDIASRGGQKVGIYSAGAGTVVEAAPSGWNGGYGYYVVIDHGNGVKTLYAHLSSLFVKVGDSVGSGQLIAKMGNTGNVHGPTGVHLHLEVTVSGKKVNPGKYIY